MKKFALLLSFLAYAGNVASEGTILVNTISFADLPAKVKTTKIITAKKLTKVTPAATCTVRVKACPGVNARVMVAKTMTCPKVSLLN
ncbi:hypothetical protein AHMF7605_06035 [Adhaeribacter arboris]|uniref:Uncharacterized protein n=1 Tax=Adhaeribacter arboris TaxID=2072846 RepID=A0A2T2YC77_9BACT|nr:hypothetical protein [Adhaeribacter arboris]PSR53117.1 hypothetical protein AHMF7605_06035 [Adhaeribacter arboris]